MRVEQLARHRCFGGVLGYYEHAAETTACRMRFSLFLPPQAEGGVKCPAVFFLSGLTCTEDNFTTKAGAYQVAAELGLVVIAPDTSPRGEEVPDEEGYDIGKGAGFYLDATEAPWNRHYRMESYITRELRELVVKEFPVEGRKLGIFGHSMGGHGALVLALRQPGVFRSVSAFAPICAPVKAPWGKKAFSRYLGEGNKEAWEGYDASLLMAGQESAPFESPILVDQGTADAFLAEQLHPEALEAACRKVGQGLRLRRQEGYDHGYFFIQSFMEDHLRHHAAVLKGTW